MELKVWVEGIQRIVCGVTVTTTCQDVVFALAHATGKVGRFTLIERWRNNERLLAPNENPLKLLLKWGEYANDVQFILQRSENKQQQQQQQRGESTGANNNNNAGSDRNSTQTNAVVLKKPLGLSNTNNNVNNSNNNNINNNSHNSNNINIANTLSAQQQHLNNNELNFNLPHDKTKEYRKSFGAYDAKHNENIGIVKGIPQRLNVNNNNNKNSNLLQKNSPTPPTNSTVSSIPTAISRSPSTTLNTQPQSSPLSQILPKHEKSHSNPIEMSSNYQHTNTSNAEVGGAFNENNNNIYHQLGAHNSKSINEINLAEVRNALDRRTADNSPIEIMFTTPQHSSSSNENLLDIYNGNVKYNASPDLYKNTPTISANGALVPPPYRDPPPPRNSPLQQITQQQPHRMHIDNSSPAGQHANTNPFLSDYSNEFDVDFQNFNSNINNVNVNNIEESESIFQATQYSDLLQLIKFQREKISAQQLELSKYDAEIVFLENKERDQAQELEAISREITKADQIFRQGSEQLQTLQYVEEENELVKQQEKTLKSEIALLRSKLANCETELLQCKNKIRILMDDIEVEQRAITNKQKNNRQNVERDFLMEMERIQSEIDLAIHNTDTSNKTAENLKKEILLIENAIAEKKRQVEQLVNEMKEVNLQSLTVTTSEEIKHLLEGPNKQGSSRRIIGSPRQLENAVPTSKNPHGVWV
ncbi:GATA zinc finger domain-containing protein 14-like isoform X1 [Teleopsis dalmanni]|uniref:GATA zinc finger domain-containing protein 14-like isoform X1 n=2 Tax=Teleopsis dalmanni TaxID=139649 RepID=UPI0018CDAFE9|nr:GATA zinc finger domain-containing protein 14-like isoform X1 [Teleopsis dalmanni]XP_037945999.1 GATA zinc finger domain-containing protein 14-like isoform X1 [Teleopsis dalmanni]